MLYFLSSLKKTRLLTCAGSVILYLASVYDVAQAEQWYTGSLLSPAPAKNHTGQGTIEPYFTYSLPVGYFDAAGVSQPQHPRQQLFSNSTLWKYGLTESLSIQAHTVVSYGWKNTQGHSNGPKFGDFPVDLIWRFIDGNQKRYIPSFNIFAGVVFPTGDYNKLQNAQNGVGTGSYVFRTALLSQSSYMLPGNHPLRLRTWGWFRHALNAARLDGRTTYSTPTGFQGHGRPGMSGQAGFSLEYGITRRWVAAVDVARDWANGSKIWGTTQNGSHLKKIGTSSGDWQVDPAVEYNFNSSIGLITGASIYYAGHNTGIRVAPQFAVNVVF
ncbi:transporter [Acetobacter sp.]|uniref:transporter n=1 Tax=Acetobacter sp. TaxID=440 RepID=UPI0039EB6BDF